MWRGAARVWGPTYSCEREGGVYIVSGSMMVSARGGLHCEGVDDGEGEGGETFRGE
jgi:hypothetical protein